MKAAGAKVGQNKKHHDHDQRQHIILHWRDGMQATTSKEIDRTMAGYVFNGRQALNKHFEFTMPTDKAHICTLPLSNSVISVPGNYAVLCCPQVFRGVLEVQFQS